MAGLYRVIKKNGYRIVHVHRNSASLVMDCFIARLCGVPVVIGHSHNTSCNIKWQHYLFKPFANLFVTDRFACSAEAGKWIFGNRSDVTVINNAIDSKKYHFDADIRNTYRKELGIENRYCVGFVGRLHHQKNLFRFLDICAVIKEKKKDAVFVLVGEGPQEAELKQYAKELGIDRETMFLGRREDVPALMMAFDVLLFPSLYEGLALVPVEAQATGLPCVISDEVPAIDLLNTLKQVRLAETDDVWADCVLEAVQLNNRRDAKEMIIEGGYDIRNEAAKLQEFYLKREC